MLAGRMALKFRWRWAWGKLAITVALIVSVLIGVSQV
jgi:hypothetical protein